MSNKVGYCQCGCGQKTRIAARTSADKGWIKGQPLKYVRGHNVSVIAASNSSLSIGSKSLSSHGYVRVRMADGSRQYEHILIAERVLGRNLRNFGPGNPDNEVVHHIDGDKQNNQRTNLLICTHAYHVSLHDRLERSADWHQFERREKHKPKGGSARVGKSGFKGVGRERGAGFIAMASVPKTEHYQNRIRLGRFDTAEEAARHHDEFVELVFGVGSCVTNKSMGLLQ